MRILNPSVKQVSVSIQGITLGGELLKWVDHTFTLTRVMPDHDHYNPEMCVIPTFDFHQKWLREGLEELFDKRICVVQTLDREVTNIFAVPSTRKLAELCPHMDAIKLAMDFEPFGD